MTGKDRVVYKLCFIQRFAIKSEYQHIERSLTFGLPQDQMAINTKEKKNNNQ